MFDVAAALLWDDEETITSESFRRKTVRSCNSCDAAQLGLPIGTRSTNSVYIYNIYIYTIYIYNIYIYTQYIYIYTIYIYTMYIYIYIYTIYIYIYNIFIYIYIYIYCYMTLYIYIYYTTIYIYIITIYIYIYINGISPSHQVHQHSASSTSPELRPEVFGRARAQGIQRRLDALRQCHQQALPDGTRIADGEVIPWNHHFCYR